MKSTSASSAQPAVPDSATPKYPRGKKYYTFLITYLVLLSAFGSFVNDMYIPSLPEMTEFFGCSVSMAQLGLTFGMIGLGVGQLVMGPLSDKYGRKPVLIIALIVFIIGAFASVFAKVIHFFLFCRFIQGLGASGGYFLARTVPADIFGGRALAKTMALIGAINGFAPASAPVIGGLVAAAFDWQGIFWSLGGFAVILLVICFFFKESLPPSRRNKGSLLGTFREYGPLLRNRAFMTHVLLKGAALGLLFAYISSAPFIMQTHYGFSEIKFGLFMGFNSLFAAAGSMVALRFKVLKRGAWVGAWILAGATALDFIALYFIDNFWAYEITLLPMIFAMGMIFTVANTLAMNEGRASAGTASAILGVMGYVFGAIVAPLVGLGDIRHSSAWVFLTMTALTLLFAFGSRRLQPDLNK